jgi:hypothetical protein
MFRRLLFLVVLLPFLLAADLQVRKSPFPLSSGRPGNVHESTHGVNSNLRQRFGDNCYYLWQDEQFVKFAPTPRNITLSQVASRCQHKGGVFGLYMRQSLRWWNDTPLYPLDEWSSYTNGSISYIYSAPSSANHSLCCMFEMAYYSHVAIETLPDTYEDKEALRQFWQYYARFNVKISDIAKAKNLYSSKQEQWRSIVEGLINDNSGNSGRAPITDGN